MADNVNSPDHYRWLPGDLEVIDITEGLGFCLGNVIKYVLRCDHKGAPVEDLKKARWYLDREIARRQRADEESQIAEADARHASAIFRCICSRPSPPGGRHNRGCPGANG